jgi:hypothetical protein
MSAAVGDTNAALDFIKRYTQATGMQLLTLCSAVPDIKGMDGHTFAVEDLDGMRRWIDRRQGRKNIYFNPNEVREAIHKKPAKTDMGRAVAVYLDVDPEKAEELKTGGREKERKRILEQFQFLELSGEPVPSFLIDSGNGYQPIWLLDEPIELPAGITQAEGLGGALWTRFGGDPVYNVDRILRLPGTVNVLNAKKRSLGRVPVLAEAVTSGGARYSIAALQDLAGWRTGTEAPAAEAIAPKRKKIGDESLLAEDMALLGEAVDALPNDYDYLGWITLLAAMKAGCGGDPEFFHDHVLPWCGKYEGNADDEISEAKWESIHDANVGAGHVFREARKHGFTKKLQQSFSKVEPTGKPVIRVVGGKLPDIVDQAESALIKGKAGLYQRGTIVRPVPERIPAADKREATGYRLLQVQPLHLAETLTRAAWWERFDARSNDWKRIDCPPKIAQTLLQRGTWQLPWLAGHITAPTLRSDGSILDKPGYDEATQLLFDPRGVEFPAIPVSPSRDDAIAALAVLKTLLAESAFITPAARSVALSAILTAAIRRSLPTAPMHGYSAPAAGSGKSYLVDVTSMIAAGHLASVISPGKSEEELEKRLGTALLAGDGLISIDNCESALGGEFINAVLTQQRVKVRILGQSVQAEVPSNALITATGNNLTVFGDMGRRVVLCTLDTKVERPELRKFATKPCDLVAADRARYVLAALTVLRAYHVAGRPPQTDPLASYEAWSGWVRDALVWLGQADPCETMDQLRKADPKRNAHAAVVEQWAKILGDRRVSTRDIITAATQPPYGKSSSDVFGDDCHEEFREALLVVAGERGAINSRRLGTWLGAVKGKIVDGKKIVAAAMLDGNNRWQLSY